MLVQVAEETAAEDGEEEAKRGVDEEVVKTEEEKAARLSELSAQRNSLAAARQAYLDEARDLRARIQSRTQKRPLFATPVVALLQGLSRVLVCNRDTARSPANASHLLPMRALGIGRKTAPAPPYTGENPHLVPEHVYGAAMADSHGGLLSPRQALGKKLIYAASGVGIVHDIDENTQALYSGNDAARVMCMALHPDDETVASCHMSETRAALSFWSWSFLGHPEKRHKAPTLDLAALAARNGVPPIRDVRAMAFGKYGDVLMLLLEHEQGKSSLLALEWRKPLWLAFASVRPLSHTKPAALACNILGDGSLTVAGVGLISCVAFSSDAALLDERAVKGCLASDAFLCAKYLGGRVLAAGSAQVVCLCLCLCLGLGLGLGLWYISLGLFWS